jgi:probable rRNA maturation factor
MILNRQRAVRVSVPALELFLRRVQRELRLGEAQVTVGLVSDAEIAGMNERFRKKKGATDVLSFPAAKRRRPVRLRRRNSARDSKGGVGQKLGGGLLDGSLGDIAIAPAVAKRNAKRFRRTLPAELKILILHGVLHLLGYDHEADRGEMDRTEKRLRRRLGLA